MWLTGVSRRFNSSNSAASPGGASANCGAIRPSITIGRRLMCSASLGAFPKISAINPRRSGCEWNIEKI